MSVRSARRTATPELLGCDRLEVVRLVDDQCLVRPQDLALTLVAGEQERMVGDNNGCICGAASGARPCGSARSPSWRMRDRGSR